MLIALATVFATLLGLAVGSFLNVVIHRVPAGMSVVSPPSHCPRCGNGIRNRHNVPVLGWLVLRGRCYDCAAPISARYPLVEALTGALFGAGAGALFAARLAAAVPAYLVFASLAVVLAAVAVDRQGLPFKVTMTWSGLGVVALIVPTALGSLPLAAPIAGVLAHGVVTIASLYMVLTQAAGHPRAVGR
ncbi:MAG TPA: prepilin peptidase [Jatrophihabitans sp.]|nr:prepilin peptidase [Jatrophihabitans sp.]